MKLLKLATEKSLRIQRVPPLGVVSGLGNRNFFFNLTHFYVNKIISVS